MGPNRLPRDYHVVTNPCIYWPYFWTFALFSALFSLCVVELATVIIEKLLIYRKASKIYFEFIKSHQYHIVSFEILCVIITAPLTQWHFALGLCAGHVAPHSHWSTVDVALFCVVSLPSQIARFVVTLVWGLLEFEMAYIINARCTGYVRYLALRRYRHGNELILDTVYLGDTVVALRWFLLFQIFFLLISKLWMKTASSSSYLQTW